MSFFGALGKIVQGKPVYDTTSQTPTTDTPTEEPSQQPQPSQPAAPAEEAASTIKRDDPSTFPVVYIRNTITRPSGENVQVYCFIHNNWHEELKVKKVTIFGHEEEVEYELAPGQERQVLVYEGPPIQQKYEQAILDYETLTPGGYFQAIHIVQYLYHDDTKTFTVDHMQLHQPIHCVNMS